MKRLCEENVRKNFRRRQPAEDFVKNCARKRLSG